ncbi:MAG: type VI secretion lipoprotein TssJ [Verrucomicrobia bacterium]|nr:type VI secretion lipoprotein TssJ [Deltaproteobacteria bacterium]
MIFIIRILLCICIVSLFSACTSAPLVKQPPEWGYEKEAIQLHFTSDLQLNLFQKQAHSLIVCLYHLRDPNGFNQLIDEKGGLHKLLECSRFDPSVTYSKRLVVQPSRDVTELMDRTDGAKYVGIVAGYYTLHKESSVRSYKIPISEVKTGSTLVQKPAKLNIDLYLGPQEIKEPKDISKGTPAINGKEKQ